MAVAQATPYERLQPCLFDRLIDEDTQNRQEGRTARVISLSDYRAAVLRDLSWLLNSSSHMPSEGLADFPDVEASVFNFGKFTFKTTPLGNPFSKTSKAIFRI